MANIHTMGLQMEIGFSWNKQRQPIAWFWSLRDGCWYPIGHEDAQQRIAVGEAREVKFTRQRTD